LYVAGTLRLVSASVSVSAGIEARGLRWRQEHLVEEVTDGEWGRELLDGESRAGCPGGVCRNLLCGMMAGGLEKGVGMVHDDQLDGRQ
jgi:hypothetical protein